MKKIWNSGQHSSLEAECVEYFREHPVFDKIFRGFRAKYASYGSFSGTVTIQNLSEEERGDLEGFFQKNFHGQKSVSVSAKRFENALKDSRFGSITPEQVLTLYFREEMSGKKEQRQREEQKWQQELQKLRVQYAGTWAEAWIEELEAMKGGMYSYIQKCYRESGKNAEELHRLLQLGTKILNQFPYHREAIEYLAVFAAEMTGNPHAFDDGTKGGQLLRLLISWDIEKRGIWVEKSDIFPAMQRQKLCLAVGIQLDDLSNYVMVSGLRAWKKGGKLHGGMEGFLLEGEPVQVPLSVIAGWEKVYCPGDEIYIVENPSVFAMLCSKWRGKKACMCMNGQPRLSAVLLLELLAKAGIKVWYAGDFDPEGLLIAQKVRQYYKGDARYWHMSVREYEESRSDEKISARRMKALERITDEQLKELVCAIREGGVAGYQENIKW